MLHQQREHASESSLAKRMQTQWSRVYVVSVDASCERRLLLSLGLVGSTSQQEQQESVETRQQERSLRCHKQKECEPPEATQIPQATAARLLRQLRWLRVEYAILDKQKIGGSSKTKT